VTTAILNISLSSVISSTKCFDSCWFRCSNFYYVSCIQVGMPKNSPNIQSFAPIRISCFIYFNWWIDAWSLSRWWGENLWRTPYS